MKEGRIHTKTVLNMRGQPVVCPVRFIAFHPVCWAKFGYLYISGEIVNYKQIVASF